MDENAQLKLRVLALESSLRKVDRFLKAICKNLDTDKVPEETRKEAIRYLQVFNDEDKQ